MQLKYNRNAIKFLIQIIVIQNKLAGKKQKCLEELVDDSGSLDILII